MCVYEIVSGSCGSVSINCFGGNLVRNDSAFIVIFRDIRKRILPAGTLGGCHIEGLSASFQVYRDMIRPDLILVVAVIPDHHAAQCDLYLSGRGILCMLMLSDEGEC